MIVLIKAEFGVACYSFSCTSYTNKMVRWMRSSRFCGHFNHQYGFQVKTTMSYLDTQSEILLNRLAASLFAHVRIHWRLCLINVVFLVLTRFLQFSFKKGFWWVLFEQQDQLDLWYLNTSEILDYDGVPALMKNSGVVALFSNQAFCSLILIGLKISLQYPAQLYIAVFLRQWLSFGLYRDEFNI